MQVIWITVAATVGIICHSSNMVLTSLCSLSNNYQIVTVHRVAARPVKGFCAGQVALSQCTKRGYAIFTVCFLIQTQTSRAQSSSVERTLTCWMRHKKKQTFLSAELSQAALLLLPSLGWLSAGYTLLPAQLFPTASLHVLGETDSVSPLHTVSPTWKGATRSFHRGIFLPHAHSAAIKNLHTVNCRWLNRSALRAQFKTGMTTCRYEELLHTFTHEQQQCTPTTFKFPGLIADMTKTFERSLDYSKDIFFWCADGKLHTGHMQKSQDCSS